MLQDFIIIEITVAGIARHNIISMVFRCRAMLDTYEEEGSHQRIYGILITVRDIIKNASDTIKITGHTIKITGDTIKITGDAIKNAGDTIKNAGDTIKITGDTIKNAGHTIKIVGGGHCPPQIIKSESNICLRKRLRKIIKKK